MAANKRKQDEKHLKILREMVTLAHNKYCFDCNQRGPTYVNMTTGSFVCTSCSGILRGLNPPHRVKSISMTSFTPEEMDFLKCHGNDLCGKVWLALYDSRSHNDADSKDEQKRKDFLAQKYERKRWYKEPTDAMLQEARTQNDTQAGKKEAKPLKTLLGHNATRLVVSENQGSARPAVAAQPQVGQAIPSHARTVTPSLSQGSISSTGSQHSAGSLPNRPASTTQSTGGAFDLLADLGADPFASKGAPQPAPQPTTQSTGFANFETAFTANFPAPTASAAAPFGPPAHSVPVAGQGSLPSTAPVQQGGFGVFATAGATQPGLATSPPSQAPPQPPPPSSQGDRYAALADLDNLFGSSSAPNPFNAAPGNFGQSQATPNPFAAAPLANQQPAFATTANQQPGFGNQSGFGAPAHSNSFPAFPAQNNSFGQFPSSQSAFGTAEVQNNGFSGWNGTSQGVKAGYQAPSQQQGFAQWGQSSQPAANPFLNITAQQGLPAKSHSTNPFL